MGEQLSTNMLAGKLVICTGGSSGIGKATARVLTREGAKVVATGMRMVLESARVRASTSELTARLGFPAH